MRVSQQRRGLAWPGAAGLAALVLLLAGCRTSAPRPSRAPEPTLPPAELPSRRDIGTVAPFSLVDVAPDGRWLIAAAAHGGFAKGADPALARTRAWPAPPGGWRA